MLLAHSPGNRTAISFVPDTGTATVTIVDDETLQVVSVAASSTPTDGYYDAGDAITFKVTFTAPVTVTGAPQFAFDPGGRTRQAAYASGSDSKELVATSVDEGDNARLTMTLTLADGLADPRDNFNLFIDLEGVTANARHGSDPGDFIVPVSGAQAPVLANRWTARSGGGVHPDRDARGRDRRGH